MLTYFEALKTVLEAVSSLDTEEKPVSQSLGQVLARDIYSDVNLPMFDVAFCDGYAVKSEDIQNASKDNPIRLNVVETVRPGCLPRKTVQPQTAIRIMIGSVLPGGADCVVRFEDTDEPLNKKDSDIVNPKLVKVYAGQPAGTNINQAGNYIRKGSLVVPRGTLIGPAQLSALTAIGRTKVKVVRRPVVAIITTGDELVRPGKPLTPGKVYDCSGEAIEALVTHYGGIPKMLGIARDNKRSVISKIQRGLKADAIITTGGVSNGDSGLVRRVLEKIGKVVFSRIKMGPGASFTFGICERDSHYETFGRVPIFALSGSPLGYLNGFEILVRPALLKMKGVTTLNHPLIEAKAEDAILGQQPRDYIQRTQLKRVDGEYRVKSSTADGVLASISTANSLVIVPEGTQIRAGDTIPVWPLEWS